MGLYPDKTWETHLCTFLQIECEAQQVAIDRIVS